MAELKSLIVNGVTRLNNTGYAKNLYADKFITNGGTNTQYVKGDGTLGNVSEFSGSGHQHYIGTTQTQANSANQALTGITSIDGILAISPTRGAAHFDFTGTDADYGVARIYHTSNLGSGSPGSYTATLALIDQRANNISGAYEPTFFINRTGATRVPDLMGVNVGGSRVFTIDSSRGYIGILCTQPRAALDVYGKDSAAIIGNTGGYSSNTSAARKLRLGLGTVGHTGSNYWAFCVDDTTTSSYLQIAYTESDTGLSLRHDGYLGIGTRTPAYRLQVEGTEFLNGDLIFRDASCYIIKAGSHSTSALRGITLPSLGSNGIGIYSHAGKSSDEGGIIITEDTCLVYNSFDTGWGFQVRDKDLDQNNISVDASTLTFGITQTGYYAWSRGGFQKSGSSNDYVLLGGGDHKKVSDFATSGHSHTFKLGNTTITTNGSQYTSITGPFAVATEASANKAFSIWRESAGEGVAHWVNDGCYHIEYTNDEANSSIAIRIVNTDTERADNKGADAKDVTVYLDTYRQFYPSSNNTGSIGTASYKWANMYATTFHGALDGNATTANSATYTSYNKTNNITETNFKLAQYSGFYNVSKDSNTEIPFATSGNVAIHAAWDNGSNTAGLDLLINDSQTSQLYYRARVGGGGIGEWRTLQIAGIEFIMNPISHMRYDQNSRKIQKFAGTNGSWDDEARSVAGYKECRVTYKIGQTNAYIMVGLNSDPTTNRSYNSIDYCWYTQSGGNLCIYENGSSISSISGHTTYAAGDEFVVEYSGHEVRYYHNGVLCRTVSRNLGSLLYFDTSFYNYGYIYDVTFGPTTDNFINQVTNWNDHSSTIFKSSENSVSNAPTTGFIYGTTLRFHRDSTTYYTDLVVDLYNDKMFFRRKADGSFGSWRELLHSGNWSSYISIPTVTNYYWADQQVQSGPSTSKSPTFSHIYMGGYLYMKFDGEFRSTIDNDGNGPIFGYWQGSNSHRVYYTGNPVIINGGGYSNNYGIYVDGSNNVGVGNVPYTKFEVAFTGSADPDSTSVASTAKVAINRHNDDGLFMGIGSSSTFWMQSAYYGKSDVTSASHAYKLSLNPLGGNVGIGTLNPTEKLHVYEGNIAIHGKSSGNTAILNELDALIIAPKVTRSGTANVYYPGIAFNHMYWYNNSPTTAYNNAAQGWIGLRLHSTPGSELSYLVFATKPGTGTSNSGNDRPIERMCIAPDGNVGIGTKTPSTLLEVNGSSLFAYSIKILPTVGISTLQNSYGLASDYTSRYNTEEFLKSWVKWAYDNGAGYTVLSYISPNSRGMIQADIYGSGINSTTGLPEHITVRYYPHGGSSIICGTSYGTWYYRNGLDSGNSSVSGGGSSWGSSITVNIGGTSKTLTIPSAPTTNHVYQSQTSTSDFRPVILGYQSNSSYNSSTLYTAVTQQVYSQNTISARSDAGILYVAKNITIGAKNPNDSSNYSLWATGALYANTGYFNYNISCATNGTSNPADAAIEVREYRRYSNNATNAPHTIMYAPRIGLHWQNRYWANIALYDNVIRFIDAGGTGYYPIQCSEAITPLISYADDDGSEYRIKWFSGSSSCTSLSEETIPGGNDNGYGTLLLETYDGDESAGLAISERNGVVAFGPGDGPYIFSVYDEDNMSKVNFGVKNDTFINTSAIITPQGCAHDQSYSYSGGGYYAVNHPNLRLIGDPSLGLSTIEFVSQKGSTNINKASDSAFIQFNPYGVSTLSSIGSAPTIASSGEVNRLIIGVTNDSNDQVWLQTPAEDGLRHVVGKDNYRILTSYNTYVSNGVGYINGTTVKRLDEDESIIYGTNNLQYLNISLTDNRGTASTNGTPTNDWYHIIRMNHGNSAGYFVDLALCFHSWDIWYRRVQSGQDKGWIRILDENNSSVSGGGSTAGSSLTVKINGVSKTLTIPDSSGGGSIQRAHTSGVPSTNYYIVGLSGTTNGQTINSVSTYGGVYYNGTGVYYTSDKRVKFNIKNVFDSDVDRLFKTDNGYIRSFTWKESGKNSFGFIAQELKKYCPEAVDFNPDDKLFHVNYNVAFAKIIGAMFKKIKEQDKIIKELEKKVNKK